MGPSGRNTRKQPRRQAAQWHAVDGGRNARDDALQEFRNRRIAKRLVDLERTNVHDIPAASFNPTAGPSNASATPGQAQSGVPAALAHLEEKSKHKKKQTTNVKNLLMYKKTLAEYLDELPEDHPYLHANPRPPKLAARKICSSCGYTGAYACPRCNEYSCSKHCIDVHAAEGDCGVGT